MGNKTNQGRCKICSCKVKKGKGIRCCGACRCWYHFKCLGYSKQRIKAIKCGILKIECPCPDCCTDNVPPQDLYEAATHGNHPCSCTPKYSPNNIVDEEDLCEMIDNGSKSPHQHQKFRHPSSPKRKRYQPSKTEQDSEFSPYCETPSEASIDMDSRYRKPSIQHRKIGFHDTQPQTDPMQDWQEKCCPKVKHTLPLPLLSRVPSRELQNPSNPEWRFCPPKPKPIQQSLPEHMRDPCQEWRERCCPQNSKQPDVSQPMPILSKVTSQEQMRDFNQEWRERSYPQESMQPMPTLPKVSSQEQMRDYNQEWRERCRPKPYQNLPPPLSGLPPPPTPVPLQQRDQCQEWRDRCCPNINPMEPPAYPSQNRRNTYNPDSIIHTLPADKPINQDVTYPNANKPQPPTDLNLGENQKGAGGNLEDVVRLVCKEVMDRGTATRKKKVKRCIKCNKPEPKCICKNDETTEDTGDNYNDDNQTNYDTNGDDTDHPEESSKEAGDIQLEDTDGAETLSLNAVEKMCKTVGKLALQMNDLMEKLRRSVTHTKETVEDVSKKDCDCTPKKRAVRINMFDK